MNLLGNPGVHSCCHSSIHISSLIPLSLITGLSTVSSCVFSDLHSTARYLHSVDTQSAPFHIHTGQPPFGHSPRIRKWEPPVRKAAPPLGENPFLEAFCHLRVLAQKMLNVLRQQGPFRLGKAKTKSKVEQQNYFPGMS